MVLNYQNGDRSLRKKNIVSFIIIFGTLSFPIGRRIATGEFDLRRCAACVQHQASCHNTTATATIMPVIRAPLIRRLRSRCHIIHVRAFIDFFLF